MKYWIILFVAIFGIFIYLNQTYAYFYHFQGDHFLVNPAYPEVLQFNEKLKSDPQKIVVLGDSLMAGTGSSKVEESLAFQIAKNLAGDNSKLSLVNLARPGVGVKDVLDRQVPLAINQKPDFVILLIGVNDVHNRMLSGTFRDYYSKILESLKQNTQAEIYVVNIPYLGSNLILYPPWNDALDARTKHFNQIVKDVATNSNISVLDLYGQFKNDFTKTSDLYSIDQFHPSDKGYALWADFISANINH